METGFLRRRDHTGDATLETRDFFPSDENRDERKEVWADGWVYLRKHMVFEMEWIDDLECTQRNQGS